MKKFLLQLSAEEQKVTQLAIKQYFDTGVIMEKCPRCGANLVMDESPNGYELSCEIRNCIRVINRGI